MQFPRLFLSEASSPVQKLQKMVEIFAVLIEIHFTIACRAIVQRGEEIGERPELLEQCVALALADRLDDEVRKGRAITVFLNQYLVEMRITPKRPGNIMWVAGKSEAAQIVEIVVFALHVVERCFRAKMGHAAKELPNDPHVTLAFLINIHMIRSGKPVYPEVGRILQPGVQHGKNIMP